MGAPFLRALTFAAACASVAIADQYVGTVYGSPGAGLTASPPACSTINSGIYGGVATTQADCNEAFAAINSGTGTRYNELLAMLQASKGTTSASYTFGSNALARITAISQSNPVVITMTNLFVNGQTVEISGVVGMTEVNTNNCIVGSGGGTSFTCTNIDSSAYTAYTSGGSATAAIVQNLASFPAGCYMWLNDVANYGLVYYNTHGTGGGNTDSARLCTVTSGITAITNANPAVVTDYAHGFANGNLVRFTGVGGVLTNSNTPEGINDGHRACFVISVTTNTFACNGLDTTGYTAYTGGGYASLWTSSSSGDPHLMFNGGGSADFRGEDKRIFAFLTAPNLQVNVMTEDRVFQRWQGQTVNGSFITRFFATMRSNSTGLTVRLAIHADQWWTFREYEEDLAGNLKYKNVTRLRYADPAYPGVGVRPLPYPDIEAMQLRFGGAFIRAAGWDITVHRRRLRLPLIGGKAAPRDHPHRYFLDTAFKPVDDDEALADKVGHSTVGRIAPHGIVGQSWDGSGFTVSGKLDKYTDAPTFVTSAQAEGAIEGVYTDYIVASPFSTEFKYARFDAKAPVAGRNISLLTGHKAAAINGSQAGSVELHGVEEEPVAPPAKTSNLESPIYFS